jgi:hypothetical protein
MNYDLILWLLVYDPELPETMHSYAMLQWERRIFQLVKSNHKHIAL